MDKYEKLISEAETLLEVFDIMKDMFEELMTNLDRHINKDELLSDSSQQNKDQIERILQNYESEINTHTKVEQNMQTIINEYKGKVDVFQRDLAEKATRLACLEKQVAELGSHNRELESANQQVKAMLATSKMLSTRKSKSSKHPRLTTSADKTRPEIWTDGITFNEFRTACPGGGKKQKIGKIAGMPTSKDLGGADNYMTMTEGGMVDWLHCRGGDSRGLLSRRKNLLCRTRRI